jgi:hypothetical protein
MHSSAMPFSIASSSRVKQAVPLSLVLRQGSEEKVPIRLTCQYYCKNSISTLAKTTRHFDGLCSMATSIVDFVDVHGE